MKLLFLQQSAYGAEATIVLVTALVRQLARNGHEISVLGRDLPGQPPFEEGISHYTFYDPQSARVEALYAELLQGNAGLLRDAAKLARYPVAAFATMERRLFGREYFAGVYKKQLERHLTEHPADAVIAVTAPYYTAQALAAAHTTAAKVVYMMDPYATSQSAPPSHRLRAEVKVNRRADALIMPPPLFRDYQNHPTLRAFTGKAVAAEFPGIRPPAASGITAAGELFPAGRLNLAYIGSLYPHLRNPAPLFALVEKSAISGICLTVMGKTFGAMPGGFFEIWQKRLGARLRLLPSSAPHIAAAAMCQADILVSLGNMVSNQLPSKLLDYISTGLPIVHIHPRADDLALPYLEHCPCTLNLEITEVPNPSQTAAFDAFCRANAGRKTNFSDIEPHFTACTPGFVAGQIDDLLAGLWAAPEKRVWPTRR